MEKEQGGLWSKDYIVIIFATIGISFCNYFFATTLPIYAKLLTGTTAYAGLMPSVYTFAALAVRPVSGILSDTFGRTRLLIVGALICAVACFLYSLVGVFLLLLLLRVLHGVGFGMYSTSGGAVVPDIVPKSRLAEGVGYYALSATVATALAPGIALSIIGDGAPEQFHSLFLLAAALSLASMILNCFVSYERKRGHTSGAGVRRAVPSDCADAAELPKTFLGFESAVVLPTAVNILVYIAISSVTYYLSLFALDRDLGNIGLFFTVTAVGMFLSRVFLGKVADRRGANVIILPCILMLALCLTLIAFAHSLPYLLVLAFPFGLAQGALGPAINMLLFRRCSPQRRGTTSAAYFSSIDIGYGVGSLLCGFVAEAFGFYVVYLGAAAVSLLALLLFLSDIRKRRRLDGAKPEPEAEASLPHPFE